MRQPRLLILCGLPATGKTTFAQRLEDAFPIVRFNKDEWVDALGMDFYDDIFRERLEQQLIRLATRLLQVGQSVVLEYGFWGRSERDALRELARTLVVPIDLYFFNVPLDVIWERLDARNQQRIPGIARISREHLDQYAAIFLPQAPVDEEFALFDTAVEVDDARTHPLPEW